MDDSEKQYFVYILQCSNKSYYVGSAEYLNERLTCIEFNRGPAVENLERTSQIEYLPEKRIGSPINGLLECHLRHCLRIG